MYKKKLVPALLVLLLLASSGSAQTPSEHDRKMVWWREARFGMFVHWGPSCLYGGVYQGIRQQRFGAEWIMNICKIPVRGYRAMASTFDPQDFCADSLVLLAKRAGMKYIVFTAKHHDGFAMFRSDASRFNVCDYTRFGRDVVDELAAACRRHGLRLGLYYSQNLDWNNPGGQIGRKPTSMGWPNPDSLEIDRYTAAHDGAWDPIQHSRTHEAYYDEVAVPQVAELLARYGDELGVLWWDTPKGISKRAAARLDSLVKRYPHLITNDRLCRPEYPGDYHTPEGVIPSRSDSRGTDWETCMTIGGSWGYRSWDKGWKRPEELLRSLATIVSRGGNFLLNVGPDPSGRVPQQALDRLAAVSNWMRVNGEAIHGGLRTEFEVPWGAVIRRDDDRTTRYYLCVFGTPRDRTVALPLRAAVRRVTRLDDSSAVPFVHARGSLRLDLTREAFDPAVTVFCVETKRRQPRERAPKTSGRFYRVADEN